MHRLTLYRFNHSGDDKTVCAKRKMLEREGGGVEKERAERGGGVRTRERGAEKKVRKESAWRRRKQREIV